MSEATDARLRHQSGHFLTRVVCTTCGWYNESGDRGWTLHAGVVHGQMLRPGHAVATTVDDGVQGKVASK